MNEDRPARDDERRRRARAQNEGSSSNTNRGQNTRHRRALATHRPLRALVEHATALLRKLSQTSQANLGAKSVHPCRALHSVSALRFAAQDASTRIKIAV